MSEKSKRKNKPVNRQRQIFILVSAFLLLSLIAATLLLSYVILTPVPVYEVDYSPYKTSMAVNNPRVTRILTQTVEAARR